MNSRLAKWYQDYQDQRDFPGSSLFGAAARVASWGYRCGNSLANGLNKILPQAVYRPRAKVIGVGSPLVGGSGKTALVEYIASRMISSGRRVVILSRGYGRSGKERYRIDPHASEKPDLKRAGDEPVMLAGRLPEATIVVDADRAGAAYDYEHRTATDVFILDDALQQRRLVNDCKIATFMLEDLSPPPPYRFLPAGRWSQSPHTIAEVDCVVLVHQTKQADSDVAKTNLKALGFTGPTFHFVYQITTWRELDGRPTGFLSLPENSRVGAFCALARPENFFSSLRAWGMILQRSWSFADHYAYSLRDLNRLGDQGKEESLTWWITTEKDAVKLARLGELPLRIIFPEVRLVPIIEAVAFDRYLEQVFA